MEDLNSGGYADQESRLETNKGGAGVKRFSGIEEVVSDN